MTGTSNTTSTTARERLTQRAPSRESLDQRLAAARVISTPIPCPLGLNNHGRLYMLSWLQSILIQGRTVAADEWREAFGAAADYQTAQAARAALQVVPS